MAVEIIDPGAGGRWPAGAARPVVRQEPPHTAPGRGLVLLPIAEVLSCRAAGAVLLDCREPAEFAAGHVRGAVSVVNESQRAERQLSAILSRSRTTRTTARLVVHTREGRQAA